MCIYSAIGPMFEPFVPHPIPASAPAWPWGPMPGTGLPISPEDLASLLDAFHKAVAAAKAADKATGQPDCADPQKVKLEERVAELERRLDAMAVAACRRGSP
jgi:hypothetical protein